MSLAGRFGHTVTLTKSLMKHASVAHSSGFGGKVDQSYEAMQAVWPTMVDACHNDSLEKQSLSCSSRHSIGGEGEGEHD